VEGTWGFKAECWTLVQRSAVESGSMVEEQERRSGYLLLLEDCLTKTADELKLRLVVSLLDRANKEEGAGE